jgi:hypothetical protein
LCVRITVADFLLTYTVLMLLITLFLDDMEVLSNVLFLDNASEILWNVW